jgi:hypothetical protein
MRANHQPLVQHIALLPANFAHNIDIATAISSSHWKNITFLSCTITSIKELAGVMG